MKEQLKEFLQVRLDKLSKEFSEMLSEEKTLEKGKWYKKLTFPFVKFKFNGFGESNGNVGFTHDGIWSDNIGVHEACLHDYKEMTHSEVEEALKAHSDKMYPIGTKFVYDGVTYTCEGGFYYTHSEQSINCSIPRDQWDVNGKYKMSNPRIYSQGKWAEIIKDSPILFYGSEVEFKDSAHALINGMSFNKSELEALLPANPEVFQPILDKLNSTITN